MRTLIGALLLAVASPSALALPTEAPATVIEGRLGRGEVEAVMARGPQPFIASLRVEAHLNKGRFIGFRILQFLPNTSLANSQSVQPGDVILSVNQESVERPEEFMRAWEVVKNADVLEVKLLRGERQLVYRWKIE